jgi:hypothetical protein
MSLFGCTIITILLIYIFNAPFLIDLLFILSYTQSVIFISLVYFPHKSPFFISCVRVCVCHYKFIRKRIYRLVWEEKKKKTYKKRNQLKLKKEE